MRWPGSRRSCTRWWPRTARNSCRTTADIAVLDIPLLFETGGDADMDAVACVSRLAPICTAQKGAGPRPGMTEAQFEAIWQSRCRTPKSASADFVIETDTLEHARRQVQRCWINQEVDGCVRSFSIPKPPGSTRAGRPDRRDRGGGAVQSHAHGRRFTTTSTPNATCRRMPFEVHGLGDDFLRDKPVFRDDRTGVS